MFNNVLFFTGKGYVLVWSDSEVEQLDTTTLVGRLASYTLQEGDKRPRRVQLHEISPYLEQHKVSYSPSSVRFDGKHIYMWPMYPSPPDPAAGDVAILTTLVESWFKSDPQ